jgi:hypothetical protein
MSSFEKEYTKTIRSKIKKSENKISDKMASDLHRTATTTYLCYVPILEDSAGAGRVGLAVANIQSFYFFTIF